MSLPRVAAYALPSENELPAARVNWQLDVNRAVLLVHDVQAYFMDCYPADGAPREALLRNIARLRSVCERLRVPVVFTAQPAAQSAAERGLLTDMWGPGITASPDRAFIDPALQPREHETVLVKWRYSAFAKTSLAEWMRDRRRDQLIISGVYAHIGCQATALDAFMLDIQPFVVADATADFSRAHQLAALQYVASCVGVVLSTASAVPQLEGVETRAALGAAEAPAASLLGGGQALASWHLLRREVAQVLAMNEQDVPANENLFELGLDSMRVMALSERFSELGFEVEFLELIEVPVLSKWCELLVARTEGG